MSRKSYATEEIIKHLRTMEIEKSKGKTTTRSESFKDTFVFVLNKKVG
jgi:hypothetical protein